MAKKSKSDKKSVTAEKAKKSVAEGASAETAGKKNASAKSAAVKPKSAAVKPAKAAAEQTAETMSKKKSSAPAAEKSTKGAENTPSKADAKKPKKAESKKKTESVKGADKKPSKKAGGAAKKATASATKKTTQTTVALPKLSKKEREKRAGRYAKLEKVLPTIVEIVAQQPTDAAKRRAFDALVTAFVDDKMKVKKLQAVEFESVETRAPSPMQTPSEVSSGRADAQKAGTPSEPSVAKQAASTLASKPAASPVSATGSGRRGRPKGSTNATAVSRIPENLDLGAGPVPFTSLAADKKPTNNDERILVAVAYFTAAGVSGITPGHIRGAFEGEGWRAPASPSYAVKQAARKRGWVTASNLAKITLTAAGRKYLEEMPVVKVTNFTRGR